MSVEEINKNIIKICGSKFVSDDPMVLESFSKDLRFVDGKMPSLIAWPRKTKHVEEILKLANSLGFSVIPVSSSTSFHYHGDTVLQKSNNAIVNLSKMNKILNIDRKNRVIMVEPGVVFGQLIPILQRKGLRILTPLHPRNESGHYFHLEALTFFDQTDEKRFNGMAEYMERSNQLDLIKHLGAPFFVEGDRMHEFFGPHMSNYPLWLRKLKEAFDPKNTSDSGFYISSLKKIKNKARK